MARVSTVVSIASRRRVRAIVTAAVAMAAALVAVVGWRYFTPTEGVPIRYVQGEMHVDRNDSLAATDAAVDVASGRHIDTFRLSTPMDAPLAHAALVLDDGTRRILRAELPAEKVDSLGDGGRWTEPLVEEAPDEALGTVPEGRPEGTAEDRLGADAAIDATFMQTQTSFVLPLRHIDSSTATVEGWWVLSSIRLSEFQLAKLARSTERNQVAGDSTEQIVVTPFRIRMEQPDR